MKIDNLTFKFDASGSYFFNNLCVEFAPHTINFIQGDNGVGKSTLFNILQGKTTAPQCLEASITLDGKTYKTDNNILDPEFTNQLHTVQQNYDRMIAPQFTFMQNLQLANLPKFPGLHSLPKATIFDVMQSLPVNILTTPAHLLSGGQRQLLAILMSLQKPTRVLLLDEPTATLDKKNAQMIMQCLQHLACHLKVTMLIICHDKELVEMYAEGMSYVMECAQDGSRILKKLA